MSYIDTYSKKEIDDKLAHLRRSINHVRFILAHVTEEYADNAAAKAAGLKVGQQYRTGDAVKVVHD